MASSNKTLKLPPWIPTRRFSLETTEKVEEALNLGDELAHLKKEHAVLDEKILALENIRFPSPEEQQQIKLLKKEKLAIKTQLETMEKN